MGVRGRLAENFVRLILLEMVSIPHGVPSPSIDGVGWDFKSTPLASEMPLGRVAFEM